MTPEEYVKTHQKAFRTAFDFLNKHFPPGDDPEWWEQTATDGSIASAEQGENRLAVRLLVGVFGYLEDEWRKRREATDHNTN